MAGYDDMAWTDVVRPVLTVVSQPLAAAGASLANRRAEAQAQVQVARGVPCGR